MDEARNNLAKLQQSQTIPQPLVFWCGNYKESKDCCFNHKIGLPQKDGLDHPLYPYEEELFTDIEKYQYLAIVKATGLGITEFFLRYAEWKALFEYQKAHIVIFTGPNLNLAKLQIKRIQEHLRNKYDYSGTDYRLELNGNIIEAFPSMNIDAARSLPNPKLILIDEAGFFKMVNDEEIRAIAERYELKSQAKVVIYSTPGMPDGMFYDLIKEEPSKYKKRYLGYQLGTTPSKSNPALTIYDPTKLEEARKSPSFEREYNLQWGYGSGDIYELNALEKITNTYPLIPNQSSEIEMDIDPGYGSSKFAILIWQTVNGKMQILKAEQYDRPSQTQMLNVIRNNIQQFNVRRLRIDASSPELIAEFSNEISTIPQNFRETGLEMLLISANMVSVGEVEIHPQFEELLRQLRAAKRDAKNGDVDKKLLLFDLGDTFRMGCYGFKKGGGYFVVV